MCQERNKEENNLVFEDIKNGPHQKKLDGAGPVDNKPSTDQLQHFVKKIKQFKNFNC